MPPKASPISGDAFIRSIAAIVRTSQASTQSKHPSPTPQSPAPTAPTPAAETSASGGVVSSVFYLVGASGPSTSSKQPPFSIRLTSDAFAIDPPHLAYLQSRFLNSPVVNAYLHGTASDLSDAIAASKSSSTPDSGTPPATPAPGAGPSPPSASPVASNAPPTASSTSVFSMLWGIAGGATPTANKPIAEEVLSVDEDLLAIYQFFEGLTSLKLAPSPNPTRILEMEVASPESPSTPTVSLRMFKSLSALALIKEPLSNVLDWQCMGDLLRVLVIEESIQPPGLAATEEAADFLDHLTASTVQSKSQTKSKLKTLRPAFICLTHMSLTNNGLSSLPASFSQVFPALTHLDLSSNKFSSIPYQLALIPSLAGLDLRSNKLVDTTIAGDQGPAIKQPLVFKSLTTLTCRKNLIEVLSGVEKMPALTEADFGENSIAEVFEVSRLAILEHLTSLSVDNNPISKLENHRINIFTYFKAQAMNLTLDGSLPSAAEKKTIQAGLTIAAVVTTANTKVTTSKTVAKVRAKTEAAKGTIGTSDSPAALETLKKKKKKAVKKAEPGPDSGNVAEAAPSVTTPEVQTSETPSSENAPESTAKPLAAETMSVETEPRASIEPHDAGDAGVRDLAPQSYVSPSTMDSPEFLVLKPESEPSTSLTSKQAEVSSPLSSPSFVPQEPLKSAASSIYFDAVPDSPAPHALHPPPLPPRDPMRASLDIPRSRMNRLATLGNASDSPSSSASDDGATAGKKGLHRPPPVRKSSMPQLASAGLLSSRSDDGITTSMKSLDSPVVLLPKRAQESHHRHHVHTSSASPPQSRSELSIPIAEPAKRARSMSPDFSVNDLKKDGGEAWMNRLKEMQQRERRAQAAASAAAAAAAAAAEAARIAREAAEMAMRGGVDDFLPPEDHLRHRDAFEIAGDDEVRQRVERGGSAESVPGRFVGGAQTTPATLPRVGGEAVGPYRRVYAFGKSEHGVSPSRANGSGDSAGRQTTVGRTVHIQFATSSSSSQSTNSGSGGGGTSLFALHERRISAGDVETGGAADTLNLNVKKSPTKTSQLPLLAFGGERRPSNVSPGSTSSVLSSVGSPLAAVDSMSSDGGREEGQQKDSFSPKLILSRPVGTASVTYRRPAPSSRESRSSGRSDYTAPSASSTFYRPATLATPASLVGRAMSLFSGDAPSVFSGISSLVSVGAPGATMGMPSSVGAVYPQAPTLPFLTMTNSLQLFLKFKIFPSDAERILSWVQGSVVTQLPARFVDLQKQHSQLRRRSKGFARMAFSSDREKLTPQQLNLSQPTQRAAYLLITDSAIYIFHPTFPMPRNPFIPGTAASAASAAAVSDYMTDVISQVRYEDPALSLKLWRRIPITTIARVDVGPNRQYLGVHYVDPPNLGTIGEAGTGSLSGGVGLGLLGGTGGKTLPIAASFDTAVFAVIKSLTVMTRDKVSTQKILDALVVATPSTLSAGPAASGSPVQSPSAGLTIVTNAIPQARPPNAADPGDRRLVSVNAESTWNYRGLRDSVWLRNEGESGSGSVVWRTVGVGNLNWRRIVFAGASAASESVAGPSSASSSWLENIASKMSAASSSAMRTLTRYPTRLGASSPEAPSDSPTSSEQPSRIAEPQPELQNRSRVDAPTSALTVGIDDVDPATQDAADISDGQPNLYLMVGWICPAFRKSASGRGEDEIASITVQSLTLTATRDYIYLASERLDVWPPPLFPPETLEFAASVNQKVLDSAIDAVRHLTVAAGPQQQEAIVPGENGGIVPSSPASTTPTVSMDKGMTTDVVPHWSPPLRVGRVRDLKRCERWRTWRWAVGHVTQMGTASEVEREAAALVQNGAVGTLARVPAAGKLSGARGAWLCSGAEYPMAGVTSGAEETEEQRKWRKLGVGAGNAAGWVWWVRVVFSAPGATTDGAPVPLQTFAASEADPEATPTPAPSIPTTATATASEAEHWWDLLFSTMDAANEFLEYVRDVRGVREDGDDDGDFMMPMSPTSLGGAGPGGRRHGSGTGTDGLDDDGDEEYPDRRLLQNGTRDGVVLVIGDD
ncbi:hypothetical protein DFJ73DRAFT_83911 [Zopfochytrium polystomum]|nr:hypothetical protein DFJ73DRAFT_83911 [Zopfochytrium polystomum]